MRFAVVGAPLLAMLLVAGSVAPPDDGPPVLDPDLGGATTRHSESRASFAFPAPNLSTAERRRFEVGDSFFTKNWVTAPASTDARDGLGPVFNAQACSSCHVLDGRGVPPVPDGSTVPIGLLLRISVPGESATGAPLPDPVYGGQLQDRSILGVPPEGVVGVSWEIIEGEYADGTPYRLARPTYSVDDPQFGPLAEGAMLSPRLAPQVIGMGLLEEIPEEAITGAADPDDEDGDGISGRPNMVWHDASGSTVLGRFGWKANVPTVEQQVAGAFIGDIGITSSAHPEQECGPTQSACADAIDGGEPELTDERLADVTFYGRTLSVPAMRDVEDDDVREGAAEFATMGCASCHTPSQVTGESDVAALSNQTFFPYTDLLLHDMGDGLADGRPDFDASSSEWRTPPLWGLGLVDDVNGVRYLLHDGRAATFEEAILWHGGEGSAAAEAFRTAAVEDRRRVLAFLEAL
jgi:CxxC motif-containing protein (DUF1111 family)